MSKDLTQRVGEGLSAIFDRDDVPTFEFIAGRDQLVLFSDLHKGARDGADEFRRSERAYNAALAYYYTAGYRLAILGDAEELWKNDVDEVLSDEPRRGYRHTLELEAKFHRERGRYIRIYGNHDEVWAEPAKLAKLADIFKGVAPDAETLAVHRAAKVMVRDGAGKRLGELWLTHGNAGDTFADKLGGLSHAFLRTVWRPLQAHLLTSVWTTPPSVDWELREELDRAMHDWASRRPERPVLIAGHTHRPVHVKDRAGPKRAHEVVLEDLTGRDENDPARPALEWELAEALRFEHLTRSFDDPPCYFNTGCGCNGDGDVMALEITAHPDARLRLVRWSSPEGPEKRQDESLLDILESVKTYESTPAAAPPPTPVPA